MSLRLRQIALVARDLEPVEQQLTSALGAQVCFRDPGVAKYGLHNALWALGGTFLEVVAPTQSGTAAGRYLDRRKGDGGYMFIVDCDDLDVRRTHLAAEGVRLVEDLKVGDDTLRAEALHLHPRDTGGCLLSIDRHGPDADLLGSYLWAGSDWRRHARTDVTIAGATLQCDDPAATAARWSALLQRGQRALGNDRFEIAVDNAHVRFVPVTDERGEGLCGVTLAGANGFGACGVRFTGDAVV
jgi:hypothetical protein